MTKQERHHAILIGRAAIQDCLLTTLLRTYVQGQGHAVESEYDALTALLQQYNTLLEKHMLKNITINAANDETGGQS